MCVAPNDRAKFQLVIIQVDGDEGRRADGCGNLHNVRANASDRKHRRALPHAQLGLVANRAIRGEHAASDDGGFIERQTVRQAKDG